MEKVYLTGAISGIEEEARKNFDRAEKNLIKMGFEVVNPFSIVPQKEDWETETEYWFRCMMVCLPHFKGVNKICKVYHNNIDKRKIRSIGAEVEHLFAEKMKIPNIIEMPQKNIERGIETITYQYVMIENGKTFFLE